MPKYAQDFNKVIPTRKDHFEVMLVFGLFFNSSFMEICMSKNQIRVLEQWLDNYVEFNLTNENRNTRIRITIDYILENY